MGEARRSHGLIFVIDGEPYQDEMQMFETLHTDLPHIPKIVFVNQWDKVQLRPISEREKIKELIHAKMRRFVISDEDIVYGSAQLYDPKTDSYIRQEVPALLDRMYENAGTLGLVMNVLDPARRAEDLGSKLRSKIMDARIRIGRKVVSWFGTAEVGSMFVPFSSLITTPGLLAGMVYTLMKILGVKSDKDAASKITKELLVVCGKELAAEFAASTAIEAMAWLGGIFLGPLALLGALGAAGAVGYYKYKRTVIFGEVVIEYLKNDCSWGGEDRHEVIMKCRERAKEHYLKFKIMMDSEK
jgi:uncharacterized protein (DUF697 family)